MMKVIVVFLVCIVLVFSYQANCCAQFLAKYKLDVNDGVMISPNQFEFDIDMTWTNADSIPEFYYAGGQYFFNINGVVANGGTMTMQNVGSDLPTNMQPRNPTVYSVTTPWQLRWAVNTFPGAGNGFQMPAGATLKIVNVRLQTTSSSFAQAPLNLIWRTIPYYYGPSTKIFQYVSGITNTEITSADSHIISIAPFFTGVYQLSVKLGIEGLFLENSHRKSDSVTILVRSSIAPFLPVDSGSAWLDSSTLTASITKLIQPGNYYIIIKYKNGMETWSKPGGEPLGNGNYFYDFTSSASQAYGNNLVLKDGLYCIYSGNVNGDDVIDAEDLLAVDNAVFNYAPGTSIANLNGDNIVDIEDMAICDNNARAIRVVERPASLEVIKIKKSKLNPNYQKN